MNYCSRKKYIHIYVKVNISTQACFNNYVNNTCFFKSNDKLGLFFFSNKRWSLFTEECFGLRKGTAGEIKK